MQTWGFRATRAATFAAVSVLLAAAGHILMSGTPIPWWAIAWGSVSIGAAAWIVADRERGVPFVLLGTIVAQAALHTVFSLAQTVAPPMDPHAMPMTGHQMTGTASLGMLIAHLLAALLCGLWLAYGEQAAFAILRSVADRILLPLHLIGQQQPVVVQQPRNQVQDSRAPLQRFLLVHAITSRGPPRGIAVA
jgi:hypothetical protein